MNVTNKNKAPRYKRDNITSYLLVSELTTDSKHITTSLVEMDINGTQHVHSHETEQTYFILEGTGIMTIGEETREVSGGDSIFISSNTPHGLINTGNEILRYLSAGSPVFGKHNEKELWPLSPISAEK